MSTDSVKWDEPRLVHRMLRYREGQRSLLVRMRVPALVVVAILAVAGISAFLVLPADSPSAPIAVGLLVLSSLVLAALPLFPPVPQAAQRRIVLSGAQLSIGTEARGLTGTEISLSEMTRVEVHKGLANDSCFDMLRFEHPERGVIYAGLSDSVDRQQVLDILQNADVTCESTGRRMRLEIEDDSPFVDYPCGDMSEAEILAAMRTCREDLTGGIRWTEPLAAVRLWQRARLSLARRWFTDVVIFGVALLVGVVGVGLTMVLVHGQDDTIRATDVAFTLALGLISGIVLGLIVWGAFAVFELCQNRSIHVFSSGGLLVDRMEMSGKMGPRIIVDSHDVRVETGPRFTALLFIAYERVERAEIVSRQIGKRNYKFLRLITNDGAGFAFGLGARSDPKTLLSLVNRCIARGADDTSSEDHEQPVGEAVDSTADAIPVAQPISSSGQNSVQPADDSAPQSTESEQKPSEKPKPDEPEDEDLANFLKGLP